MSIPGWIDHQTHLDALTDVLADAPLIGLDTEFVRVSTFHPKPGLIQIAVDGVAYLIDPLANLDLNALGQVLKGSTTSVLHAAQEDLSLIHI